MCDIKSSKADRGELLREALLGLRVAPEDRRRQQRRADHLLGVPLCLFVLSSLFICVFLLVYFVFSSLIIVCFIVVFSPLFMMYYILNTIFYHFPTVHCLLSVVYCSCVQCSLTIVHCLVFRVDCFGLKVASENRRRQQRRADHVVCFLLSFLSIVHYPLFIIYH